MSDVVVAVKTSVLIAEDDNSMSELCRIAFEARGHTVTVTHDGLECVKAYKEALKENPEPFGAVILDYRMPRVDGLEAAKEILKMNKGQRIIFASAYVKETLLESVTHLEQIVELIQKPFEPKILVNLVEDISTTKELEEINKLAAGMDPGKPDSAQINELLEMLKKIQKVGF
jgi:DNA-binding NtrC family response regulator